MSLVECVPNFSEGRDKSKVDSIVEALCSVPDVALLDREMDADHNRCVITIVGPKEAVAEAAVRGVGKAAELIDLTKHQGAHPRIGAADVVPFVPVEGVKIDDLVDLAHQVGERLWRDYKIPVYFYEEAARRPDRTNLENIRRGQFEGLRDEVKSNPDRKPDVGEPALHPTAGATVVGARKFLIAYNINLNTPDVDIAKQIAKAIRFSTGGLRFVKAMGVDLKARGLAQVSINMTDFERTPLFRVFEMVRREAARYGVAIVGSEIVGLVPKKALEQTADFFLQLENFDPQKQVLENRLAAVVEGRRPPGQAPLEGWAGVTKPFLDAVAKPSPTPGGGSCAALAGALAAGLGHMVAKSSSTKKSLSQHASELKRHAQGLAELQVELRDAVDRDAASFEAVLAAMRMPKSTEAEKQSRQEAVERANQQAAEVPLRVAQSAEKILDHLGELTPISSPAMSSDLKTGQQLAVAAMRGALENVRINLGSIQETTFKQRVQKRLGELETRLSEAATASP